jgi:energy-coupling factor transporter ATP-binding protein EcfA2
MSEITFGKTVSLDQAANVILHTPMNRYLLEGEPGIGKSTLIKAIAAKLPTHEVAYIDVPNMDLGDIAMPVVDHETRTTKYYPNARFKLQTGKPAIIMLDEYTKGAQPVKNMLHPLLEVTNPRLGDMPIHPDSIIFLTGNLSTDGVGDQLPAHSRNRIIPLQVRKPDAEEWINWGLNNGIEAELLAWARQYQHAFASYTDGGQAENPYIFNPRKQQKGFVSGRSLERASNIVRVRKALDSDTLIAAMSGAVGESAARDIQAYIDFADQLPTWEQTITHPTTALVPTSAGACAVLVYGAIAKVDKSTITPFMQYLERFDSEWQACFAINIAKSSKQSIAFSCKAFSDWVAKNEDLL